MPSSSRFPYQPSSSTFASSRPAPTKNRTLPASRSSGAEKDKVASVVDADIEDFSPPAWRTVLNRRADLGWPDFYPSRPGFQQPEDVLTEENVKNGFAAKTFLAVGAESFSMHGPIHNHLMGGCLDLLNKLGQEVLEKRDEAMPQIGERAFRIPVRVTYNDSKRLQFLSDLANPSVPLHRLMRNPVPHGFKGLELLDTLFSPAGKSPAAAGGQNRPTTAAKPWPASIPLERAVWFIRVLGSNEISAHRGRAQPAAQQAQAAPSPAAAATPSSTNTVSTTPSLQLSSSDWYTQEFTNTLTAWLRVQLLQLALPGRPGAGGKPGAGAPKGAIPVLADEKLRGRWLAKWEYSTTLLRELHTRRLVSTRILCNWLAEFLSVANLAQLGFVVQLVVAYLADIGHHTSSARLCVLAACTKIHEVRSSPGAGVLAKVEGALCKIVMSLCSTNEELLVNPPLWRQHSDLVLSILARPPSGSTDVGDDAVNEMQRSAQAMRARSEKLLFKVAETESTASSRRQHMDDIHKLDSMLGSVKLSDLCLSYFDGKTSPTQEELDVDRLQEKIDTLLNWSLGAIRLGLHRAYLVYSISRVWDEIRRKTFESPDKPYRSHSTNAYVEKWMDTSRAARNPANAPAVGIVLGPMIRFGRFSYEKYLQSLIARGLTARWQTPGSDPSHHLALLRHLPISSPGREPSKKLLEQRRIALIGDEVEARRRDEERERELCHEFEEGFKEYLPEPFGLDAYGRSREFADLPHPPLDWLAKLDRHIVVLCRDRLYPVVMAHAPVMTASALARVQYLAGLLFEIPILAGILTEVLRTNPSEDVLHVAGDALLRLNNLFTAMDCWSMFINATLDRHLAMEARGEESPTIWNLMLRLARDAPGSDSVDALQALVKQRAPAKARPPPPCQNAKDMIAHVKQLLVEGRADDARRWAAQARSAYGDLDAWAHFLMGAICAGLQAIDKEDAADTAVRMAVDMLLELQKCAGEEVPAGIAKWLDTLTIAGRLDLVGHPNSERIITLLLQLSLARLLSTITVINKLVVPLWKHAVSVIRSMNGRVGAKMASAIDSTVTLVERLLLSSPPPSKMPPKTLLESLRFQTERADLFACRDILAFLQHLPLLLVCQGATGISAKTAAQLDSFVESLAMIPEFKTAAFRHLDELKDAFLSSQWAKPPFAAFLEARMVEVLKLIMSDGSSSSSSAGANVKEFMSIDPGARLSAWRWTKIVLDLRVEFKRLAMRIENDDNVPEAKATLNQLVRSTLDRETSPDDADLLCEAFKGIEAVVAQEILAVGLERLATLLSQVVGAETQDTVDAVSKATELLLRVLHSTATDSALAPDNTITHARHRLIDLLSVALQAVERQLSADTESGLLEVVKPPQPALVLGIVMRLLSFVLGLRIPETTSLTVPKPDFARLAVSYFRVLSVLAKDLPNGTSSISHLQDMLLYIIDSCPAQARIPLQLALLAEASTTGSLAAIHDSPSLASTLPYTSPPRRTMALLSDALVSTDETIPLDDRPWELFEHMGLATKPKSHGELFLASKPLRDTASIPMGLFGIKVKRDAIPQDGSADHSNDNADDADDDDPEGWERYASERNLGDGLAGEPMATRQIASQMYAGAHGDTLDSENGRIDNLSPTKGGGMAGSPVGGKPRRMSMRLASSSSAMMKGSNKDPITIEGDSDASSDEDDNADVPLGKRARTTTGGKTVPPAAAAGKRPTTGGKNVGRKTTGGKNVGRKSTGGKTYRGGGTVGTKAPRGSASGGGRRKSVNE